MEDNQKHWQWLRIFGSIWDGHLLQITKFGPFLVLEAFLGNIRCLIKTFCPHYMVAIFTLLCTYASYEASRIVGYHLSFSKIFLYQLLFSIIPSLLALRTYSSFKPSNLPLFSHSSIFSFAFL